MSLNSLTNEEIRRRERPSLSTGTRSLHGTAGEESNAVTSTLSSLVKYIPTEVITLYIVAISVTVAVQATVPILSSTNIYLVFALLTPFLLLLLYMSKLAADKVPWPNIKYWPWWKMIAAGIAFSIWALAIPGNPFVTTEVEAILAGFGALLISFFLSVLEPIAERILPKPY